MEHPLIGNIDHLTEDELSEKINELNRKLNMAIRSGNGHMCNQLRMAIESFQSKYQQKLQEARKGQSTNFDDKIDIK
jgi:ribonuclease HIII